MSLIGKVLDFCVRGPEFKLQQRQKMSPLHMVPTWDLGYLWQVREIVSSTSPHRCWHSRRVGEDFKKGVGQCGGVSDMAFLVNLVIGFTLSLDQ